MDYFSAKFHAIFWDKIKNTRPKFYKLVGFIGVKNTKTQQ